MPVGFEARLANLANASAGRIGVAAVDLSTGHGISVMGDQPFPLASTGKVAIVATFLEGVDQGRFRLSDRYPLMMPLPSRRLDGEKAPVRAGAMVSAEELIELAITRSDNHATDALLAAIGGPQAVTRWLRKSGITGIRLDRDIATMVRDDGLVDPARTIDLRDSTTPQAMAVLLAGLYQGQWLSTSSRDVLLGAMSRCRTGVRRLKSMLPGESVIGHKTGTLSNTSSDVGLIRNADGHTIAVAIYVTGQGGKPGREHRIATIARAIYDGDQRGTSQQEALGG
jgi:beta-lactamase class A